MVLLSGTLTQVVLRTAWIKERVGSVARPLASGNRVRQTTAAQPEGHW
jgi:hypothetical protein